MKKAGIAELRNHLSRYLDHGFLTLDRSLAGAVQREGFAVFGPE